MKFLRTLRTLAGICVYAATAQAFAAPTLIVSNGVLTGASGVNVGGTLYDVTFSAGSCVSLFNGCVQSAFSFNNYDDAMLAANALLDQVLIDGPAGNFDSSPDLVFGCIESYLRCSSLIPYGFSASYLFATSAANADDISGLDYPGNNYVFVDRDFGSEAGSNRNYALFKLAPEPAAVPEPSSIALLSAAMAGLALTRRRRA